MVTQPGNGHTLVLEARITLFVLDNVRYRVTERAGQATQVVTIEEGTSLPGGGRRHTFTDYHGPLEKMICDGVGNLAFVRSVPVPRHGQ